MLPHHDHVTLSSIDKVTYDVMQIATENPQNHIFTSRQANKKRPFFCLPSLKKNHKLILHDQQMWEHSVKSNPHKLLPSFCHGKRCVTLLIHREGLVLK